MVRFDLCGINADGQGIAVEVKGWHTENITAGHINGWPTLFRFAQRPEAAEAFNSLLKGHPSRKVLVIGVSGVSGGPGSPTMRNRWELSCSHSPKSSST